MVAQQRGLLLLKLATQQMLPQQPPALMGLKESKLPRTPRLKEAAQPRMVHLGSCRQTVGRAQLLARAMQRDK